MKSRAWWLFFGLALGVAASMGVQAWANQDVATDIPPPRAGGEDLNEVSRVVVWPRMMRHGDDMEELIWSVLLLEHDQTEHLADSIASEPKVARPLGMTGNEVNAEIPERFFIIQDLLQERAGVLARTAAKGNDADIARAFGQLTETCVACHATFFR
ncbi:MAG: hypothetical protein AB2A00_04800 [Myxococcota bacterium]